MKSRIQNMTEGNPMKLIFFFALPLMVGNVFQQLYVVVDTMVVGQFLGVRALAALGSVEWLNWSTLGIITGFTQGFSIQLAQNFGAGDEQALKKTMAHIIQLSLWVAVILTVISHLCAVPVLNLLNTPPDIMSDALIYLRTVFTAIPIVMAYNVMASALRALGNGKSPLIAMIIAACINVALDVCFVVGFGWGIFGAAFATVIAQVCSCIYCFIILKKIKMIHPRKNCWQFAPGERIKLLGLGIPMAFQNMIIAVGGMVVQAIVNGYGVIYIAGFTATNKLYGVLEVAATSYGYSMTTYVGQNLGAMRIDRIKKGLRSAFIIAMITSGVIMLALFLFGNNLISLFVSGSEAEVEATVTIAHHYLMILNSLLYILYILHIYRSALQGMGDTFIPMLSGGAEFLMRVVTILWLPRIIAEEGLFWAEITAWIGAVLILVPAYYIRVRKLAVKEKQLELSNNRGDRNV